AALARALGQPATRLGRPFERIRGGLPDPGAARVDEVPLNVEDELALAPRARLRERLIERSFGLDLEPAALLARGGIGRIEREQSAGGAAGRNQKIAPGETQALRVSGCRLVSELIRGNVGGRQRNGREFAVRCRVELDRQAPAFGVDAGTASRLHRVRPPP